MKLLSGANVTVNDFGIKEGSLSIGPITLTSVPASCQWTVAITVLVSWTDLWGAQRDVIPVGMTTDLASVPGLFQNIVHPAGPIKDGAVFHDFLYQYRPVLSTGVRIGRAEADYLLYRACLDIGKMSVEEATVVYTAVRVGGSVVWHRHDEEFKEN